jgi:hypothetical protein
MYTFIYVGEVMGRFSNCEVNWTFVLILYINGANLLAYRASRVGSQASRRPQTVSRSEDRPAPAFTGRRALGRRSRPIRKRGAI